MEQKKLELAKKTKERQRREKEDDMLFSMMGIENKIEKASDNLLQALNDTSDPNKTQMSASRPDFSVPSSEQIRRDYYQAEMKREQVQMLRRLRFEDRNNVEELVSPILSLDLVE